MADAAADFASWLAQADIPRSRLTPEVVALLQAVFRFRQQQGTDYFSTRLLSHFLLHAGTGLKVAQIARLLGISRPTASRQQSLSSKQAIQQAHHRLDGRPYGKLLPRYAGAIAEFLVTHPDATRADLIDFVFATFGVRVSRIALYKFLKKYGLDQMPSPATPEAEAVAAPLILREQPPAPRPSLSWCRSPSSRRPPFLRTHAVRRRLPADGPGPLLAEAGPGLLRRRLRHAATRAADQRLRPSRRPGTHLPPGRDGGSWLRRVDRGPRCPSRYSVGGWRRHLPWYEVDAFCRRTSPWHLISRRDALVSYDEHTIPRWTHKFHIAKGYVTTRNKYMRCEKLFYGYDSSPTATWRCGPRRGTRAWRTWRCP